MSADEFFNIDHYNWSREEFRRETLKRWPPSLWSIVKVSKFYDTGFYYVGNGIDDDVLQCFACHSTFDNWQLEDDPRKIHIEESPLCPYLQNEDCSRFDMTLENNRIRSFGERWPTNASSLAMAGFYRVCREPFNHVQCFVCNYSFKNWTGIEDPLYVHLTANPDCRFVKFFKCLSLWQIYDMNVEENRLRTFKKLSDYEDSSPTIKAVAKDGFFYTGFDGCVRCAFCGLESIFWQQYDKLEHHHTNVMLCSRIKTLDVTSFEGRFSSFNDKLSVDDRKKFASTGFFSSKHKNTVECFVCRSSLPLDGKLEPNDSHHSPSCFYSKWMRLRLKKTYKLDTGDVDLLDENARLETLKSWPVFFVDKLQMAKSGFYYDGNGYDDLVKCVFCECVYRYFAVGDDPHEIHHQKSAKKGCVFVVHRMCEMEDLAYKPGHPHFHSVAKREESFKLWPTSLKQSKRQMAEAGFVYKNQGDVVYCYCCEATLNRWRPEDDPWREHQKAKPMCAFLLLKKGYDFLLQGIDWIDDSDDEGAAKLREKPEESKEESMEYINQEDICKICLSDKINVVFVPCGHIVSCSKCAFSIKKCPMCRRHFKSISRLQL